MEVRDATLHKLKHVDVDIPLGIITVVTGVAGSGKFSLIRDVFAKQHEEQVVLIDQSAITATGRSTVCTFLGFLMRYERFLGWRTKWKKQIPSLRSIYERPNHSTLGPWQNAHEKIRKIHADTEEKGAKKWL